MKEKYIGILHPKVQLTYMDFLFYDYIQLVEHKNPSLGGSNDRSINNFIHSQQALFMGEKTRKNTHIDRHQYESAIKEKHEMKKRVSEELLFPRTQAISYLLGEQSHTKAISLLPTREDIHNTFIEGFSMKFMEINTPVMSIRHLIQFKDDNQDKIHRLRLALNTFSQDHGDYESTLEEISTALFEYNKSVTSIGKECQTQDLEFKFSLTQPLFQFLSSFDLSVFDNNIQIKKEYVEKKLDLKSAKGVGTSYLYAVHNEA